MRSHRLTAFIMLSVAIAAVVATPLKRHNTRLRQLRHSAQQVVSTTAYPVQAKTGYPPAGFRPRIPFELPNERQPKALPDVPSTTAATEEAEKASTTRPEDSSGVNVDVEVVIESEGEVENDGKVPTTEAPTVDATNEIEVVVEETNPADEVETHTPSIEYGPPVDEGKISVANDSATVTEPIGHFQPPNREAEEFAAPTFDTNATAVVFDASADDPAHPVADFPTTSVAEPAVTPSDVELAIDASGELDEQAAEQHEPAITYGPPSSSDDEEVTRLPAETYGVPTGTNGADVTPPEVEEEDFGLELNELESAAAAEEDDLAAEQIDLLSGFNKLQSGRLIFVPADGSNLRQIFFTAPSPNQRRASRNDRFVNL